MLKPFSKYLTVGAFNTAIHWFVFAVGVYMFSVNQAAANLMAFATAFAISYFVNATFTFQSNPEFNGYFLFVSVVGFVSIFIGKISDYYNISPIITLIVSTLSTLFIWALCYKLKVISENKL